MGTPTAALSRRKYPIYDGESKPQGIKISKKTAQKRSGCTPAFPFEMPSLHEDSR